MQTSSKVGTLDSNQRYSFPTLSSPSSTADTSVYNSEKHEYGHENRLKTTSEQLRVTIRGKIQDTPLQLPSTAGRRTNTNAVGAVLNYAHVSKVRRAMHCDSAFAIMIGEKQRIAAVKFSS